jgi:hypothetical protein
MFIANGTKLDLQIQFEVNDSFKYSGVARDVFNAIMDWSNRTASPIECLYVRLLITDDQIIASQQWDGKRTIIFLTENLLQEVKSGIIVISGVGVYRVIMNLLNIAIGIK